MEDFIDAVMILVLPGSRKPVWQFVQFVAAALCTVAALVLLFI